MNLRHHVVALRYTFFFKDKSWGLFAAPRLDQNCMCRMGRDRDEALQFYGDFWTALVVLALFGGLGMGEGVSPTGLDMAICSGVTFFNYYFFALSRG